MAEHSRYNISKKSSDIENGILRNKLEIKDQKNLEDIESILLADSYFHFAQQISLIKINLEFLFEVNKYFLGNLYSWAGKLRNLDISKNGTLFALAIHLKQSLKDFEKILEKNMPSQEDTKQLIAKKLSVIHCELNAIHPFREGNGRTIRLFIDLICQKTGYKNIDYSKSSKTSYLNACISGMTMDYSKMEKIIYRGLKPKPPPTS